MENRILFFTYWYPSKNNKNSGVFVKRHAATIAGSNSIKVLAVIISRKKTLFRYSTEVITEEGIETHYLYLDSIFYKLLFVCLPLHFWYVKKYVKRQIQPDFDFRVVHSNILFPCAVMGYWLSEHFRVKHVITEHWSKVDKFFSRSIYRYWGKKALDSAAAITCVSRRLEATVKQYTSNRNFYIVPNVVDDTIFFPDPTVVKNDTLTFTAVAHWAAPKNPFYFLDALALIKKRGLFPEFQLFMVGEGKVLEEVKNRKYDLDIRYISSLSSAQLREQFNRSHLFLHGSDYETFSVVIVEALMCGIPCVVSPVGVAQEIINANNGMIAQNDSESWANAILWCQKQVFNGYDISKGVKGKYAPSSVANLFDQIYRKIET